MCAPPLLVAAGAPSPSLVGPFLRAAVHPLADDDEQQLHGEGMTAVRHGYPWVPTNQAHDRSQQVGLAYQKTHRPVSGPNRPSWRPTRPLEDLLQGSPDDLIQKDHKTWPTRQYISEFRLSRSTDMETVVI
jgi:hypothetical protein